MSFLKTVIVLGLLVAIATMSSCASRSAKKKNAVQPVMAMSESLAVIPLQGPMTKAHANRLSMLTVMALERVARADIELDISDYDAAKDYLRKASLIMEVVRSEMPAALVVQKIRSASGDITLASAQVVRRSLVPVFKEMDELEAYLPAKVKKARASLNRAKYSLKQQKLSDAKKHLRLAALALNYGEVDVQVGKLNATIQTVRALISRREFDQARKVLDNSQYLVAISSEAFLEPIEKGR